jgi:hypothetical protein
MLGGYAVKSLDTTTGIADYTPVKVMSVWGEVSYGKEIEVAIFAGYTKNLGTEENTTGVYYGRGTNIHSLYRVSPRVQFDSGKTRISAELEYTAAQYGTINNLNKNEIININEVSNYRLITSFYYFF